MAKIMPFVWRVLACQVRENMLDVRMLPCKTEVLTKPAAVLKERHAFG